MDLKIDPEFADMIPPLTPEEYEQLEANILAEGAVLSPLIVWNGVIVDGHNRYRIIQQHPEITYTTHQKEFADRYEAIMWICTNQLGRRNLTEIQKRALIGKQYAAEKARHGFNEGAQVRDEHGQFRRSGQNDQSGSAETTRQRIAREHGVSDSYVRHSESILKGMDAAEEVLPGVKHEILSGRIKPTLKSVEAIARASPEDRKQLAEDLRKPRPSPKKKDPKPVISPPFEEEPEDVSDQEESEALLSESVRPTSALAISESMASSPDRRRRDAPVETIIEELTDALEGMIFRWDFCLTVNQPNASQEECRTQIRLLAAKGIEYLNHIKEEK